VPESIGKACARQLGAAIKSLVFILSSRDGLLRQTVRRSLVAIGAPAVGALASALRDSNQTVRWEAAKALGEIGSPEAAPALVAALEDSDFGVRWLAAEGLIGLGREGMKHLLQALIEQRESDWLREGAIHVLRSLVTRGLHDLASPVLAALADAEPRVEVVNRAQAALDEIARAEREKPPVYMPPE